MPQNEADLNTCGQDGCENPSVYRFTWPGRDEMGICDEHVGRLRGVAEAMGLYVQIIPLRDGTTPKEMY